MFFRLRAIIVYLLKFDIKIIQFLINILKLVNNFSICLSGTVLLFKFTIIKFQEVHYYRSKLLFIHWLLTCHFISFHGEFQLYSTVIIWLCIFNVVFCSQYDAVGYIFVRILLGGFFHLHYSLHHLLLKESM